MFSRAAQIFILFAATIPLSAKATLTPTLVRGEQIIQIHEPGLTTEICVIPKRLNRAMYSAEDLVREQELCSLVRGTTAAVCPKLNSTNPGLDFYSLPLGTSAATVESRSCMIQNPTATAKGNILHKEAKYKYSTSCSYTPSILGYYHLSRILGGAGDVQPAVLRTFDLSEHKHLGELAIQRTTPDDTIHQTWQSYLNFVNQLPGGSHKDQLFTDNLDQSYGALQSNPNHEDQYAEFFNGGATQQLRYANFKNQNQIYRLVTTQTRLQNLIQPFFTVANVQKMEQLKDVVDMIVLDTILSQEDRLGNIHFQKKYAYLDRSDLNSNGLPRLKFEAPKTSERESQLLAMGAVKIKKMLLKDNDCGVTRENHAKEFGLLDGVAHISPLTYKRLLMLNSQADQPEVKQLFAREMMFTPNDWVTVRGNLLSVVQTLQSNCRIGKLKLDLDSETFFANQASPQTCDLQ